MAALISFLSRAARPSALSVAALLAAMTGVLAAIGPFQDFSGSWSGTGTISVSGGSKERLRCRSSYRVTTKQAMDLDLQLQCASDSYKFEFTGSVSANENGSLSGRWTETSRGVGGTILGRARGDRVQVLVETSAFSADLTITTRGNQQSVALRSRGGGETAEATITLHRQ